MNTAEAKVMVRAMGTDTWRDSLDFDPVQVPVLDGGLTNAWNNGVMELVEAIEAADAESNDTLEHTVVWSESGHVVKAVCPECDDVFVIADGWVEDFPESANSGASALHCGCLD